jgi:hypothetical protein
LRGVQLTVVGPKGTRALIDTVFRLTASGIPYPLHVCELGGQWPHLIEAEREREKYSPIVPLPPLPDPKSGAAAAAADAKSAAPAPAASADDSEKKHGHGHGHLSTGPIAKPTFDMAKERTPNACGCAPITGETRLTGRMSFVVSVQRMLRCCVV